MTAQRGVSAKRDRTLGRGWSIGLDSHGDGKTSCVVCVEYDSKYLLGCRARAALCTQFFRIPSTPLGCVLGCHDTPFGPKP